MPKMGDNRYKGRLLIQINITVPKDLNENQLNKLRGIYNQ